MKAENKHIWLASYPKSGNTWFRVFLSTLLGEATRSDELDINDISTGGISSGRQYFDRYYGFDSTLLTADEISDRRHNTFLEKSYETYDINRFVKTHEAYTFHNNQPLLGQPNGQLAIYIVRNPLDVIPSYANHQGTDKIDKVISQVANPKHGMCLQMHRHMAQIPQHLATWSQHVETWLDQTVMPVHLMRYEDMIANPFNTFKETLEFAGIIRSDAEIDSAIEATSFEKLQSQEAEKGFKEKGSKTAAFFRKGKVGSYRESLTEAQINQVVRDHEVVMKRLSYLTHSNQLLV